jgi:hypothetical protein
MNAALFNKALYDKLSGGTALTSMLGGTAIFQGQAPETQAYPYVVYSWQGGGQTNLVPDLQDRLEFVRAYGTSGLQAGSADALINTLLHGSTLSLTGWSTVTVMREDDYETVETPATGVPVYVFGGLYRIMMDV